MANKQPLAEAVAAAKETLEDEEDLVEGVPAGFILKSVVESGKSRWHALGLEIYSGNTGKVAELTSDKPVLADKLQAIIKELRASVGAKTAAGEILRACRSIHHPIYFDVIEGARTRQSSAQGST